MNIEKLQKMLKEIKDGIKTLGYEKNCKSFDDLEIEFQTIQIFELLKNTYKVDL